MILNSKAIFGVVVLLDGMVLLVLVLVLVLVLQLLTFLYCLLFFFFLSSVLLFLMIFPFSSLSLTLGGYGETAREVAPADGLSGAPPYHSAAV